MSILQFFRILWARRIIIFLATLVASVGAVVFVQVVTPKYQAQTRMMLDVLKPDPVTGQVMATAFLRAYTKTQIELVKDVAVAREVVDALHWDKNKKLAREYRSRPASDDQDFTRWAAQKVIDGTDAKVIEGSNILEIDYNSSNPDTAKQVVDAVRNAYIATTLQARQEAARRNADWYDAQANKAKTGLFEAEQAKTTFEKENGILLQEGGGDLDSARLAALASQAGVPAGSVGPGPAAPAISPSASMLTQLDYQIAQASKVFGPNHPMLVEMHHKRDLLAKQVEEERSAIAAGTASYPGANVARVTAGMLDAQKAKVLGQREKVERLRLLQDDVNLRREEYNKSAARASQLRQEAEVSEAGVTPMGAAVTPQTPIFPQKPLVIAVGIGGGFGFGVALSLLLELFGRRIRSSEDLRIAIGAPVLAVVAVPHTRTGLHLRDRLKQTFLRRRGVRTRALQA